MTDPRNASYVIVSELGAYFDDGSVVERNAKDTEYRLEVLSDTQIRITNTSNTYNSYQINIVIT